MLQKNKMVVSLLMLLFLNLLALPSFSQMVAFKKSPSYKTMSANIIKKIPLPKGYHEGLFLNDTEMWVNNGERGKVWIVNIETGEVSGMIEPPASFIEGISRRSEGVFFVTDWNEKKIYIAHLEKNKLIADSSVSVSPAHPAGVLWNGNRLFVITWTRGMGTKFDLLEMDSSMNLVAKVSIKDIQEPDQLAWDGKNLWITSWYNSLVYKVDINDGRIIGDFLAPCPLATGIVWGKKYIWITGTYSDLYKLEITE